MSGKGSKPRPFSVTKEQFDKSFETIFGNYIPPYMRNRLSEQNKKEETKTDHKDKQ
jgi:hypothetical protein